MDFEAVAIEAVDDLTCGGFRREQGWHGEGIALGQPCVDEARADQADVDFSMPFGP